MLEDLHEVMLLVLVSGLMDILEPVKVQEAFTTTFGNMTLLQIPGPKRLISEELDERGLLVLTSGLKGTSEQGQMAPEFITTFGNILQVVALSHLPQLTSLPLATKRYVVEIPLRSVPVVQAHWVGLMQHQVATGWVVELLL